ncbi:glycosyltransferase [Sphingopyxis sp.]|uniref:glycosyltransferase n=1 Tax=Sphingopyxis sp. TaxID=1908224 RepID=UPI0025EEBF49|nr:glycosyltransferase [Sphingopyxis sp.]
MPRHGNIGLVAIGRNEGERLRLCLGSVPGGMPIAYVDSASTDGSADFARSMGAVVVDLDLAMPFTAARARNAGLEAILGAWPDLEYIQFVDGDCELEPGWLAAAEAFLRSDPAVAAVCGRRRERYPERSFYNRMCDGEWNTPIGEAEACGGDAMFRVDALAEAKGYDPAIIAGEEPELCHRLRGRGWRVRRIDSPMTIHDADMHRTRQWWMRTVRSGFGYAQVWQKTRMGKGEPLYFRQLASALFWTFGVVLAGLLAALVLGPVGLLAVPVIWLVQLARLTRRGGFAWGWHMLAGKLAETSGILRYLLTRIAGRKQGAIFYK